jgi:hypothetical protein
VIKKSTRLSDALFHGIKMHDEIKQKLESYEKKVTEFKNFDEDLLWKEIEKAEKRSARNAGSGAESYFAAWEVLKERSREKRKNEVFSKSQANWIMWSTVTIAFFTAYPILKSWCLFLYELGKNG